MYSGGTGDVSEPRPLPNVQNIEFLMLKIETF